MPNKKRDGVIFLFRFLAATTLLCATLACFGAFHVVTIDNAPIVEDFLGYNCSSFDAMGQEVCESTEQRHYSLWGVQDEFTLGGRRVCVRRIHLRLPSTNTALI